jgi:predicted O-methyltransferase YrrM
MWEAFREEFAPHLAATHRWDGFTLIADLLYELKRPVRIVETGTTREESNWAGDGQSTIVWGWIVKQLGGSVTSIDTSAESLAIAKRLVPEVQTIAEDSVVALRTLQDPQTIDLLYLDSMDLTEGIDSPTHQLAEIASIYPRLQVGAVIASDDCITEHFGKHVLTEKYLATVRAKLALRSAIHVWIKE